MLFHVAVAETLDYSFTETYAGLYVHIGPSRLLYDDVVVFEVQVDPSVEIALSVALENDRHVVWYDRIG